MKKASGQDGAGMGPIKRCSLGLLVNGLAWFEKGHRWIHGVQFGTGVRI